PESPSPPGSDLSSSASGCPSWCSRPRWTVYCPSRPPPARHVWEPCCWPLDGVLPESASPGAARVGAVLLAFGIALIRSAQHKKADPRPRTAMGLCTMLFVLPGLLMFWSGVMG